MIKEYDRLVEEILKCRKCRLWRYRKNPVPGEGPLDAIVMFVGEAPGRNEDEQGRPFVGAAGKLLTELIELTGLRRSSVYITNIVKCRPPGNRDPQPDEIKACLPYLIRQIKIIRPKIVVALGRHSASILYQLIGKEWKSMARQHGESVSGKIEGIELHVIPTYHPAAALYNPGLRERLVKDFEGPIKRGIDKILYAGENSVSKGRQRLLTEYLDNS